MLIDTHCHIHSKDYELDTEQVLKSATHNGVQKVIVIGTDVADSKRAIHFAKSNGNVWASVGLHPHDAKLGSKTYQELGNILDYRNNVSGVGSGKQNVVAIGECGLDYYYSYSSKIDQEAALHFQMELAQKHGLPMIFHVRDAFDDFWPIFDSYSDIRGVVHSFTAEQKDLDEILRRDLLVGINGIVTFTKDVQQLEVIKSIPLKALVLETDAPFLTPTPFRGKVNQPKQILVIAEFLRELRNETLEELSATTTKNAEKLLNI